MPQIVNRRCSTETCRMPLVSIDHGRPYIFAGAVVLAQAPLTILCSSCRNVTTWEEKKAG